MREVNIKIIEDQSEEITQNTYISQSEKEALLYKYCPELYKKEQTINKKRERVYKDVVDVNRKDEYYDVKFSSMEIDDNEISLKIEIKSDMKL